MATTEPRTFLQSRLHLSVVYLVILTTVFSWLNLNSWSIMLLVACRLLFGNPRISVGTAFRNRLFLAYLIFAVVETAGLLHTHHPRLQLDIIAKDATLVAMGYVLCAGRFADRDGYRRLLGGYYFILAGALIYCLVIASRNYLAARDSSVFFYHALTRPISQNAVIFSVYVVFGLLFLLSPGGQPLSGCSGPVRNAVRIMLAIFFIAMIVLLSSKLILVIALLIVLNAIFRKYSFRRNRSVLLVLGSVLVAGIGLLGMTDNTVSRRYRELAAGDLALVRRETFDPGIYFNALQLRLLEWRFGFEILREQRAWLFGVSPGDSQDLLNNKYVDARMFIGNPAEGPGRKNRGYIGYNFHDQYLETLVRDGLAGLFVLLVILVLLVRLAMQYRTPEAAFIAWTIVLLFVPESPLTMQHGVFLFSFFPLLLPYGRKNAGRSGTS
ncbi:MAG TPA: O-antigen ligase family protein [Puia sp.]|nr:O-antigen ligase family protein [Puia sp.]